MNEEHTGMEGAKMELKTVQASAFRTLWEALKEVLTDVNLQFTPDGLKISSMDGAKSTLVYLKLFASKFEYYFCDGSINAGVNMISMFKLMKTISNQDTVSFFIKNDQTDKMGIRIENKEKKTVSVAMLKLLDIDEDILSIPDVTFDAIITMPSTDFQRYCRDMQVIASHVTLSSFRDEDGNHCFEIATEGDFANTTVRIGQTTSGLCFSETPNADASGTFPLKYLNLFTKSTNLCSTVEIYLKDTLPLILEYSVANLGQLRFMLSPTNNDDDEENLG
jgi:proliferating cell nuclear antigen